MNKENIMSSLKEKILPVALSAAAVGSVLTACGKAKDKEYSPTPSPAPTATLTREPTSTVVGPTPTPKLKPTPTRTPILTPTITPEFPSSKSIVLSINARSGYEVVQEPNGRIWMPKIGEIEGGNETYTTVFKVSDTEKDLTRVVNAVNAAIYEDTNRNGVADNQDQLVIIATNGQKVTLKRGAQYVIKGGANNGAVSFEIPTEPVPTVAPTVTPKIDSTPTKKSTPTPEAPKGPIVLSVNAQKGYEIVIEPDGRIWMPNIEKIPGGNEAYSVVFITPSSKGNLNRILNAINAQIFEDTDRNGVVDDKDIIIAGNVNGLSITLKPNVQYILKGGAKNGGAELAVR